MAGLAVTRIETDLRFSTLAWNAVEGGTLEPPPTVKYVDFYEYEHVDLGKPWGYWTIDSVQGDEWVGTTISETRCSQNIKFIQLEVDELIPAGHPLLRIPYSPLLLSPRQF